MSFVCPYIIMDISKKRGEVRWNDYRVKLLGWLQSRVVGTIVNDKFVNSEFDLLQTENLNVFYIGEVRFYDLFFYDCKGIFCDLYFYQVRGIFFELINLRV